MKTDRFRPISQGGSDDDVDCVSRDGCRGERRRATPRTARGAALHPRRPAGRSSRPRLGSFFSDARASGWFSSGAFKDGPTITGVARPIASATTDNARLSATPCASLFSELKLHGANNTTPRGGRASGVGCRERDDGRKAKPDQPTQNLGTARRCRRATQHQIGYVKALAINRGAETHLILY